jgi:hypothetical protein
MSIIPKKQYELIWKISWTSLISAVYAFYTKHYRLSIVPTCVLITSLNYWRYPIYGWRRNCDMSCVCLSLIYQSIIAYSMKYSIYYYCCMVVAMLFYPISRMCTNIKFSTYAHCAVHVIANIANIILYTS